MAHSPQNQFFRTYVKEPVQIYADVKFGASGSASLQTHLALANGQDVLASASSAGFQGIQTVSQAVSGVLTVTFQEPWARLINYNCDWSGSSPGPVQSWVSSSAVNSSSFTSGGTAVLAFADQTGTLTTPASGTEALMVFTVCRKLVP